jgi:UDP-glucuronate decarboxylase
MSQDNEMKRVLVTGASGFIGQHVVALLAADPTIEVHTVTLPGVEGERGSEREHPCDLLDEAAVFALTSSVRPNSCIHLAWNAVAGGQLAGDANTTSLHATFALVRALGAAGCAHFTGVGTGFEYAEKRAPLSETDPCAPLNLYAACKLAAATVIPHLAASYGMKTAWARLFFLYGPGEATTRLVPSVVQGLLHGEDVDVTAGEQWYDYSHVIDAARGLVALSKGQHQGIYNVASGQGMQLRTLIEAFASALGRTEQVRWGAKPYRPQEPMHVQANITKLRAATGFAPAVDLETGVRTTVEFWRAAQKR